MSAPCAPCSKAWRAIMSKLTLAYAIGNRSPAVKALVEIARDWVRSSRTSPAGRSAKFSPATYDY